MYIRDRTGIQDNRFSLAEMMTDSYADKCNKKNALLWTLSAKVKK